MNAHTRATFPSLQLRPASFVKALSILGIFIVIISYSYWSHLASIKGVLTPPKSNPAVIEPEKLAGWTQRIWQTSRYPEEKFSSEHQGYMKTWTDLNPGYQHKLLTDDSMAGYVRDHFHAKNPDVEETFFQAKDVALQLNLIKYLTLWAEGGVYSDLDVACVQPISQWVPPQFINEAGVVLGVQSEQKVGPDDNINGVFGLADWTIMSKPNQPFLWFLYQRLTENIKHLAAEQIDPTSKTRPYNVFDVTGRNALTQAFLAYATSVTAAKVTGDNFTKLIEPVLFGEIVILPIHAFAAPHQDWTDLVHHYEAGSWKQDPLDKLQPTVDEQWKKKEEEEKKQQQKDGVKIDVESQNTKEEKKVEEPEEQKSSPAGNSTSSTDVSTKGKVDQSNVNGTAESSKPATEDNKSSEDTPTSDKTRPASDKPPSVQYKTTEVKEKPTTDDKPPSVQYENAKVEDDVTENNHTTSDSGLQSSTTDNPATKSTTITSTDTETKAKEEQEAKEESENQKAAAKALEQERKDAAARKAAEAEEIAEAQKVEAEKRKKAAEAKKKEEEEERLAEEAKRKSAEPKWAPLKEAGKLEPSNNLADYGHEFVSD